MILVLEATKGLLRRRLLRAIDEQGHALGRLDVQPLDVLPLSYRVHLRQLFGHAEQVVQDLGRFLGGRSPDSHGEARPPREVDVRAPDGILYVLLPLGAISLESPDDDGGGDDDDEDARAEIRHTPREMGERET